MKELHEARGIFRNEYDVKSELVRASQVAEILSIPISTLHQLVREGRFPIRHQKIGRLTLFALDELALWHIRQRNARALDVTQRLASRKAAPNDF
ncbi:helix-turn-helix domain-containing protein [Aquincola tertiaricarbonis]|uniref:Helix-turn-helix domain-containing protein n=2 Tax=Aquincola tertiaricarbonis TaxID=391953 RepID=A0ABY4S7U9_AQUTE|nr:helix-turn-helix domain-containing protein [Aquincola tertiaricarbonis]